MNTDNWIKVTDQMPPVDERVLTYDTQLEKIHISIRRSSTEMFVKDITHWRSLPEPPELSPLPCPFCGCGDIYITQDGSNGARQACCSSCLTRSAEYINRDAAVAAWNRRAGGNGGAPESAG
jgi:Lar family restriction alleviation protein